MKEETMTVTSGLKTGYSDVELEEFRQILLKKKEEAESDLNFLKESLVSRNLNDTSDTSPTYKWATEEGCQGLSREDISHLISKQETYIKCLKNALTRIKNKTYGFCLETGELIPKDRLRAVPHTNYGVSAKANQPEEKRRNVRQLPPSRFKS
jgi:RNA polymerase-binding transcription factor DksA